ncbi:hypothetical protein OH77DRAFT_1190886 [Trametes cingulata]|nr:hypothetical protein OH77DRAFT_1190886 [Trametes cingulata]
MRPCAGRRACARAGGGPAEGVTFRLVFPCTRGIREREGRRTTPHATRYRCPCSSPVYQTNLGAEVRPASGASAAGAEAGGVGVVAGGASGAESLGAGRGAGAGIGVVGVRASARSARWMISEGNIPK